MTDKTPDPCGSDSSPELGWSLNQCHEEGAEAGRLGKPFDDCPFFFSKAKTDQQTFNEHWKPRLNAWFQGWKSTSAPIKKKFNPRWHKQPNTEVCGNERR